MSEQEPCVPITLLLAALDESERLRAELCAYRGEPDVMGEFARLGLSLGGDLTPLTARLVAAISALQRTVPGGLAPRDAVARLLYGIEPGASEIHALRVHMQRARDALAPFGRGIKTLAGFGFALTDAPNERRVARRTACKDCGVACVTGRVRCNPCHARRKQSRRVPCPDCGKRIDAASARCRPCLTARRRAAKDAAAACPGCGGRKHDGRGTRCKACYEAARRRPPSRCIGCGVGVSGEASRCRPCYLAADRGRRRRLGRAS